MRPPHTDYAAMGVVIDLPFSTWASNALASSGLRPQLTSRSSVLFARCTLPLTRQTVDVQIAEFAPMVELLVWSPGWEFSIDNVTQPLANALLHVNARTMVGSWVLIRHPEQQRDVVALRYLFRQGCHTPLQEFADVLRLMQTGMDLVLSRMPAEFLKN